MPIPPPPQEPGKSMDLPADPGEIDWNNMHDVPSVQDAQPTPDWTQPAQKSPSDWTQPAKPVDVQADVPTSIPTPADWTTMPEPPAAPKTDWAVPSTPQTQKDTPMDLPDFSDEDIAALDQAKPALPELPVQAPEAPVPDTVDSDIPSPDTFKEEPTKFITSQSYFMILNEFKASRRGIRQNDEVIKDAALRHEQLDMQYKRVASDINAVQENLIKIDEAL